MTKYFLLLCAFFAETQSQLRGQVPGPIQADRPDQSESPFTTPKNHFQTETGFVMEKTNSMFKTYTAPSILFKYGLSDQMDVGVETDFSSTKPSYEGAGLHPVTLVFREKMAEEKGIRPATAFIGYLTIPKLASEKLQGRYLAPAFRFTMQNTLSDKISLSYNIGSEWSGDYDPEPTFIYTLTTGFEVSEKINAFVEIYGFAMQDSPTDNRFDAGLTYLVQSNLAVDISAGVGMSEIAPDYFVGFGFSLRLKD